MKVKPLVEVRTQDVRWVELSASVLGVRVGPYYEGRAGKCAPHTQTHSASAFRSATAREYVAMTQTRGWRLAPSSSRRPLWSLAKFTLQRVPKRKKKSDFRFSSWRASLASHARSPISLFLAPFVRSMSCSCPSVLAWAGPVRGRVLLGHLPVNVTGSESKVFGYSYLGVTIPTGGEDCYPIRLTVLKVDESAACIVYQYSLSKLVWRKVTGYFIRDDTPFVSLHAIILGLC